jgi:hypothetical protein
VAFGAKFKKAHHAESPRKSGEIASFDPQKERRAA